THPTPVSLCIEAVPMSRSHRKDLRPRHLARRPARRGLSVRPFLEPLEDRTAPAVLTVNTTNDDTTPDATLSLREAIGVVNSGPAAGLSAAEQAQISGALGSNDTIQFSASGTGKIQLGGELDLTKNLAIQGPGAKNLTVSANGGVRVFFITAANVTLDGLTISDAAFVSLQDGGGIRYTGSGTLNVLNCAITNNSANSAGGIFNSSGSSVNVVNGTLSGNQAGGGGVAGAIWNNGGTLNVTNSTISGNISNTNEAGGIWNNGGTTTLLNTTIFGNQSRLVGGGVW